MELIEIFLKDVLLDILKNLEIVEEFQFLVVEVSDEVYRRIGELLKRAM